MKLLMKAMVLFALTMAAAQSYAQVRSADGDGQGGNGGAGISRNGRYMTFYSAGFYTKSTEEVTTEIPQMAELLEFFNTTPYMSEMTKVKYASNLLPSSARRYFRVKEDTFTPEVRARLIAEYGRVMNVNTRDITLFAITDTQSNTTYLFPEFYRLLPVEQKAILYHETFWILNPTVAYDTVINSEMAFQAYLEAPTSVDRLIGWLHTAGYIQDILTAAYRVDLQNHAMSGLLNEKTQTIAVIDLFGSQYFGCQNRMIADCEPFIKTNAYALSKKYPNSIFIKVFFDHVSQGNYSLKINSGVDFKWDAYLVPNWQSRVAEASTSQFDLSSLGFSQTTISTTIGVRDYSPIILNFTN